MPLAGKRIAILAENMYQESRGHSRVGPLPHFEEGEEGKPAYAFLEGPLMSQPAAGPDDVAARLSRLFQATQSPGMISVYLFGSHAEHRAHRESDVDVGVLLDRAVSPAKPPDSMSASVCRPTWGPS
jgi:hypothetical protein